MLIENIEHRLNDLIKNINKDTFIFDFYDGNSIDSFI